MEGKRFGLGLVAGLVLGFAIIAGSGGLNTLSTGVSPSSSVPQGSVQMVSTTATQTSLATKGISTSTQPSFAVAGNGSASTTSGITPTPGSSASNADLNIPPSKGGSSPANPSRVQSIAHQSLATDAVVFLPVFLALLLGAVLYVASRRPGQKPTYA